MNAISNSKLTKISRVLRKNMTREEKHLWYDFLKSLPITIHRQKVFGNYIADFYCASAKIVIELDGRQHLMPKEIEQDRLRDLFFEEQGIKIPRYSNTAVNKNFHDVCMDILKHLS